MSGSPRAPRERCCSAYRLLERPKDAHDDANGPSEVLSLDVSPLPEVRQALIVEAIERRELSFPAIEDPRERRCSAVSKVGTDREGSAALRGRCSRVPASRM